MNATLTAYEIKRDERVARNKAILAKLVKNNPLHQLMMKKNLNFIMINCKKN